jgi:ribosomal protein S15P/S13E
VGFAPTLDDGYALVIDSEGSSGRTPASGDDLLALAIAYFEESLGDPPEALAATHGDIGTLVRHVAEHEPDADQRRLLSEAVDAIDDGQAADVVMARLAAAFGDGRDALAHLETVTRTIKP